MKMRTITVKNVTFTIPAGYRSINDYATVCRLNLDQLVNNPIRGQRNPELENQYRETIAKLQSVGL